MADPDADPPFLRIGAEAPASPIILSVPHAGRAYRPELVAAARLPLTALEALEDPLVDRLIWRAQADGAVAIIARAPRAEIDLNRDEREIDPMIVNPPPAGQTLLPTARTRGGLGLIPTRIAGAAIWRGRIERAELQRRIETIHRSYHDAIAVALEAAWRRFGAAVLLDCHSMPARGRADPDRADVVLGDRHSTSAAPARTAAAAAAVRGAGYTVARNAPYAGGHVVHRHGRPAAGVHALQIEIDRSCYLAQDMRSPGAGFDRAARMLADVASALAGIVREAPAAEAAE